MPIIRGKYYERRQPLVKVRLSNAIPHYVGEELSIGPAAEIACDVWALVDTGATHSVIDRQIQVELMLLQQGSKPVLFPNMGTIEFHPTYTCGLHFFDHYSDGAKVHEWKDWLEVLSFDLTERTFKAVIGMDVLQAAKLSVDQGLPIIEF
ncbi:MAG: hypothetical protein ACKVS5_08675 [Parvularculaceae bacterium]